MCTSWDAHRNIDLDAMEKMGSGSEFQVGPHIMIIGLDQKTMQTLNQDVSKGEPYVNHLPGHLELFLVIPLRESDDAQAARTIGAAADRLISGK